MLVTQGNLPVTTTQVGIVIMVNKINYSEYRERGEELKVLYYTNAAAAYNSNLPHMKVIYLK